MNKNILEHTVNPSSLIFLLGEAGSGKDTIGEFFINKGYTRVAFGDAAKEEFAKINLIPLQTLHIQGPTKELYRYELIKYAEAKRNEDPLYWIKKAITPFLDENNNIKEGLKLVFTDIRRVSEIDWIYDFKKINEYGLEMVGEAHYIQTKLFLIEREGVEDDDKLTHEAIGYAKGINYADPNVKFIDAIIKNNNTKEDLYERLEGRRVTSIVPI